MEVSKDKITQLYNKYPQFRLYKTDEFLKVMVEKGELTPKEAELISQPSLFNFDLSDNCGLQLEHLNQPKYHSEFHDIEVDYQGKIKTEQFEPEKVKAYWKAKGYEVEEKNGVFGSNCIINIINNRTQEKITYNFLCANLGQHIYISKKNGTNVSGIMIDCETQSIESYREYSDIDENSFSFINPRKFVSYKNNKPAFIEEEDATRIDDSYMRSFIQKIELYKKKNGKDNDMNSVIEILNEVPLTFLNAFFEQYKKETGTTLLNATADYPDLYECVQHFSNEVKVFKSTPKELAHIIENELNKSNPNSDLVSVALTFDIAKLVDGMEEYDKIQQDKFKQKNFFLDKIANYLYFKPKEEFSLLQKGETMKGLLDNVISSNIDSDTKSYIIDFFINVLHEGNINTMSVGIFRNVDDEITKLLETTNWKEAVKKIYGDKYKKDIENDIISNSGDTDKVMVSVMRLRNRPETVKSFFNTSQNGKIDHKYEQGNTGDCWLIAGITSILNKDGGKEYLAKLLDYDQKTGNVKVNLKGVNKEYTVTADEIKNSNHLATGDFDIRAFEIAVDKYMRDCSFSKTSDDEENILQTIDIVGNSVNAAFRILVGQTYQEQEYDSSMCKEFNNKDMIFSCCIYKNSGIDTQTSLGNKQVKIEYADNSFKAKFKRFMGKKRDITEFKEGFIYGHCYSVIGSDEENIFIKNPWYPDIALKISVEDFEKLMTVIGCADFNIS